MRDVHDLIINPHLEYYHAASPLNISLQSPRRNQLKGNQKFFLLMEDLLCHEKWAVDMSPLPPMHVHSVVDRSCCGSFKSRDGGVSVEEYDRGIRICLEKEVGYMPDPGYAEMVRKKDLVSARARIMHWLIKSRSRLRLTHETLFLAANCFDRFISIFKSQEWEYWMLELLSVSCLSVSIKFMEAVIVPSLHEIQIMKDLDHSFEHGVIKKMELTLLQGLGWRLGAITAYSYMNFLELKPNFMNTSQVQESLLCSLFDIELVKFRPSTIVAASAALTCEKMDRESSYAFHANLIGKIIPDHVRMGEVLECKRLMQLNSSNLGCPNYYAPSSPVTVLVASHIRVKDSVLDHDVSS